MGAAALPSQVPGDADVVAAGVPTWSPTLGPGEAAATLGVDEAGVAAEHAARRSLREQIARLEQELADAFVTAYPLGGLQAPGGGAGHPRLLDLGELEVVRDDLTERLRTARRMIARRADEQAEKRILLERMLLRPADHRFVRISCRELGEPGCGVWQVRPRLGLIGMLMGWWQVKLSSGCPLSTGRGPAGGRSVVSPRSGVGPGDSCVRC